MHKFFAGAPYDLVILSRSNMGPQFMSYDAYDIKYEISPFGRSWCLNDRLDLSNHTCSSDVG